MDLTKITNVVRSHLSQAKGIQSLQLQNHIYGCFILMEDIAQKAVDFDGTTLTGPNHVFHLVSHFSQIGIRYGFVMDIKSMLEPVPEDYRAAWMEIFQDVRVTQDIELVDRIEDALNDVIHTVVPLEEAFFIQASASGSLPTDWIVRALAVLHPDRITLDTTAPIPSSAAHHLADAKTETAIHPSAHRRFSRTRRHTDRAPVTGLLKKGFAKTRRNTHIH